MKAEGHTGVIIVLYNTAEIQHYQSQATPSTTLIIVDNTPDQDLNPTPTQNIIYHPLKRNLGIAAAQNAGIEIAKEIGCSHVVFFDQDSTPPKGFINNMVTEYERIESRCPNLFLLGPTVINGRTSEEYKSTIHKDRETDYGFIPRREIISSGSCVSMRKIEQIGMLDGSLFIDYVDFEWCWSANAKGFVSGLTPNVTLTHYVGQNEYHIFNQLVIISSPIRYYYQTRNHLWLTRRDYVPRLWKINTAVKHLLHALTFPFKTDNWTKIYSNIYKGFIDGLKIPTK